MATFSSIVFLLAMFIHKMSAQGSLEGRPNPCLTAKDCAACMARGPECIWCLEEYEKYGHCQPRSWNLCLRIEQSTAETHKVTETKRRILQPKRLISPQKIDLQLNKGASAKIIFFVYSRKPNFEVSLRHSKVFDVTVESKCKNFKYDKKLKKASCKGVKPGKVELKMVVKLRRCPKKNKKIKVMMQDNSRKRSLKIKVISRCSCDCQKESEPMSARCNKGGRYVCGSCQCDAPFYGKSCECNTEDTNDMRCLAPGEEGVLCSYRGECVCGACHCHQRSVSSYERYSGQYCECDDYSCDYYNDQICGGATRGRCVCGECMCFEGYSGTACQADLNTGGCLSVRRKSICNNAGVCVNNECQCIGNYRGPTCDECAGAPWNCTSVCVGLKDCVDCFVFNSGPLSSGECYSKCAAMNSATELVDSVSITERGGREFKMCMLRDDDGCLMKFAYDFSEDDRYQIQAERKKMCPEF